MAVLLANLAESSESWVEALRQSALPLPLRVWPEIGDLQDVRYAIVAQPPAGFLATLPNLRAILSLWAGVDHITEDPDWPSSVPIYRMIEPGLTAGMVEFVLAAALNLHLSTYDSYDAARRGHWTRELRGPFGLEPLIGDRRVGVLGLGQMGGNCALALAGLGFRVAGWSRTQKQLDGIDCLCGPDGLESLLARSEILINLLPLTPATEDILNADAFRKMPRGAGLIQVGRGQHLVDADLIEALDEGQLSRAILDVYRQEPLAPGHRFWSHPRIVMFPHIASITRVRTGVPVLLESLRRLEAGEAVEGRYDPARGY